MTRRNRNRGKPSQPAPSDPQAAQPAPGPPVSQATAPAPPTPQPAAPVAGHAASDKAKADWLAWTAKVPPKWWPFVTAVFTLGGIIFGYWLIWSNLEAMVTKIVSDKTGAPVKDLEAKQKEYDLLMKSIGCQNEMQGARCQQQYAYSVSVFDDFRRQVNIDTVPAQIQMTLYKEYITALVEGRNYASIKKADVDRLANLVDGLPQNDRCESTHYEIGVAYLCLQDSKQSLKYLLRVLEPHRQEIGFESASGLQRTFAIILLTSLLDSNAILPNDRSSQAARLLDSCEGAVKVPYTSIAKALSDEYDQPLGRYLRLHNPDGFAQTYTMLLEYVKKSNKVRLAKEGDETYIIWIETKDGKPVERKRLYYLRQFTPNDTMPPDDKKPPGGC